MTSLGHHHLHQFVTLEKATTQQMTCIQTVFTSVHDDQFDGVTPVSQHRTTSAS